MLATWNRYQHRNVTWRLKAENGEELACVLYLGGSKRWCACVSFGGRGNRIIRGTATAARQSAQNWLDRRWDNPEITNPA